MIDIDSAKCTGRGNYAKICHEYCNVVGEKSVKIDYGICSTCCQCIAIYQTRALSWDRVALAPFEEKKLPSAEQMAELLGRRRTVRIFKDQKLERTLLEEIADFGVYGTRIIST